MTKILLVEDDINLREIYAARLGAEGYDIVTASDGEEALTKAVAEKPSVIVLDVMMPKISGFDVLDILRSTPETKDAKVVMLSALSQETDKDRGEKLGADKYLVKSQITLEDVVTTVKALVAQVSGDGDKDSSAIVATTDKLPSDGNPSPDNSQSEPNTQTPNSQIAPSDDGQVASTSNPPAQASNIEGAISSQIDPTNQNQPQQVADTNASNDQAVDAEAADNNQSSLPTRLTATPDEIAEIEALVQSQNSDDDTEDDQEKEGQEEKKTKKSKKEDKKSKKSSKKK
ncbi:MAG: response regulator [Candidatus Saccharimonadales bacterium]